ncbi:MAG: ABC transporter ATP-binding protein, partial [Lentisphaeria bacterium]|nr:ABC transporter ATP-binding protein [Lentisphaeria bacterium]
LGEASLDLSPGVKARIGYVPQEPELYPWMRVGQAIAYQGSFYPRWDEKLVAELLDRFELEPRKRVGALSVGQLQKLAILLALASGPEVLLLDEPVAALDPEGRRDFLRRLVEMVADGERTILLSTHITSDVERVCSHVAVLCRGSLLLHEDLDAFRDSLKELRLPGVSCPQSTLDSLPATLLRVQATPTGTVAVVRGNVAGCVEHLHRATGIVPAVVDLNLEDAFIELQADGRKQA